MFRIACASSISMSGCGWMRDVHGQCTIKTQRTKGRKMRHKPRAGILWTRELPAYQAKRLGRQNCLAHAKNTGDYDEMIRTGEPYVPNGFMTQAGLRDLARLVKDLAPDFLSYYQLKSEHVKDLGTTLAQRARFCLPGHDELETLK